METTTTEIKDTVEVDGRMTITLGELIRQLQELQKKLGVAIE